MATDVIISDLFSHVISTRVCTLLPCYAKRVWKKTGNRGVGKYNYCNFFSKPPFSSNSPPNNTMPFYPASPMDNNPKEVPTRLADIKLNLQKRGETKSSFFSRQEVVIQWLSESMIYTLPETVGKTLTTLWVHLWSPLVIAVVFLR